MRVLILGKDGMLGNITYHYFKENGYDVCGSSREKGSEFYFDVCEGMELFEKMIENGKFDVVINCIGVLNDFAEKNKSLAVLLNSYFPHYVNELSSKYSFKFIHISTDCVFSGKEGNYYEDSLRDAYTFYGRTKALGEIESNENSLTIRTSIVGPNTNKDGIDLFSWYCKQSGNIHGYRKVFWTGVTTLQCAKCMMHAIENNLSGLIHAVNGEAIDKYSLLKLFQKFFNRDVNIIENDEMMSNKTLMLSERGKDFCVPSYETMIEEMHLWVLNHKELYNHLFVDGEFA